MQRLLIILATLGMLLPATAAPDASPLDAVAGETLVLPTDNDHLLREGGDDFYMYVYRKFEGEESRPWTGGKYGFVRSLRRTEDGVIGTRFHEGIDIKPIKRDRSGKPLDEVRSIAGGSVVHINASSGKSSYGKYIVIRHLWQCGPVYSLYAHLSSAAVELGQQVEAGQRIGQLGYTGTGINRDRAHLHLELGLLLSSRFPEWHGKHFSSPNYHGKYNGMNIAGLDIASFFLARRDNPGLTIPQFVKTIPVHYKVTVPRNLSNNSLELLSNYPWLASGNHEIRTPSWEISFSASGFPISITPSNRSVSAASISSIRQCRSKHEYHTKGFVSGTGKRATLSKTGQRFIQLVCGRF